MTIRVSVIGASGYGGMEAVRLLAPRPDISLAHLTAESRAGKSMAEIAPNLRGIVDRVLEPADAEQVGKDSDVVIISLPSGLSTPLAEPLLNAGARVIDIGADFRLKDGRLFKQWYKKDPAPEQLLKESVYGLPELHRDELRSARLVANPGCFPNAALLALIPILRAGVAQPRGIIIDAKTGISGAGRGGADSFGFSETQENTQAYKVAEHQHTPEIEQELAIAAGEPVQTTFVPHLVPMIRGILVTAYVPLKRALQQSEAYEIYREAYGNEPFIRVLESGTPQTKATYGANFCDVAVKVDPRSNMLVCMSAIDNLGKGAAGQAIQNLNLMCGLPESTGLRMPGLYP